MSDKINETTEPVQPEQDISELLQIRRDKLTALQNADKDPFVLTTAPVSITTEEIRSRFEELENKDVCIAGRVMSWRDMGKASFMDVYDRSGRMQVYLKIDQIGEESYEELKSYWDLGDIISVTGYVFKTRRGEISVHAKEMKLLSKSLLPMPEKFHGLKDTGTRTEKFPSPNALAAAAIFRSGRTSL
jgi:lysyl-tRNA synthetase class 2